MVQSETDDIFVFGFKAKDMITMHIFLLFLLQWENKNYDLIANGSLIFGMQRKMSADLLCPSCLLDAFCPNQPYFTIQWAPANKKLGHNRDIAPTGAILQAVT